LENLEGKVKEFYYSFLAPLIAKCARTQKAFARPTGICDEEDLWDCKTTKGIVHPFEWDRKGKPLGN
jgi:hypothetical protein